MPDLAAVIQRPMVCIVEDDAGLRRLFEDVLQEAGYVVSTFSDAESAWDILAGGEPVVVVSDLRLPRADGLALLERARALPVPPGFILITAFGTIADAVRALKQGADDFLTKPVDLDHLVLCVRRVEQDRRLRQELEQYRRLLGSGDYHGMIGRSPPMQRLFTRIRQMAKASGPVLITGESGVGKELAARALHAESQRPRDRFVAVNCAGLPPELLESELFGHAAGAFTGAIRARQGLFAEADGGTLLLDEIGELPAAMQAKLLRILDDGYVRPVGANREEQLDVRVIAATNRDLEREVAERRFRSDLFYRLETFALRVPPLRERSDDLELLTAHFIDRFNVGRERQIKGITSEALRRLRQYPFPGNVRELGNIVERAVTFCNEREIGLDHLPDRVREAATVPDRGGLLRELLGTGELPGLAEVERRYIELVLSRVDGNKRRAAEILGIGRRTLYRRLSSHEDGPPPPV
jgi:DNA-binding NtrC family response regulator